MDFPLLKSALLNMLRIRSIEEKIVDVYPDQQMKTPTHLSIGQEAVSVGLCQALNDDDQLFCSHRCHAAYLAKGGDVNGMFAEICGRVSGVCEGRSGSAHLTDVQANVFASPILGALIPVAVGAALSFKMDASKRIAVALFGDAAVEEGVFAESINFAVTRKLPVLFVCENNLYSTHSPLSVRQPASPIYQRVQMPELATKQIDGNDVVQVYETMQEASLRIRRGEGPLFVECLTYRYREHVGPFYDYDRGYRSREEVEAWEKKCPIKRLNRDLLEKGLIQQSEIDQYKLQFDAEANDAYTKALNSPWPEKEKLMEHVY